MRYLVLFLILFLTTYTLSASHRESLQPQQSFSNLDNYASTHLQTTCESSRFVEAVGLNRNFIFEHSIFDHFQCPNTSIPIASDPYVKAPYQPNQRQFSTIR